MKKDARTQKSRKSPYRKLRVSTVSKGSLFNRVRFEARDETLMVPRSSGVSEGSVLEIDGELVSYISETGERTQILPIYSASEKITVGNIKLDLVVKEISDREELAAYRSLSQYHYRTHSLAGRRTRLVVRNTHPLYPSVIGYIDLTTCLFMNKARSIVLDSNFTHGTIHWKGWDLDARRTYTNRLLRIARCVVYPEFRGLGLGKLLVRHAAEYAKKHWHVGGQKPLFLEIAADMLKFVPFAQKAGMIFIGETEGNLNRVARDMRYLLGKTTKELASFESNTSGFLDQQIARAQRAGDLMKREGWSVSDLVSRLKALSSKTTLRDYDLFRGIVSFPKPTYLMGLTNKSHKFIKKRVAEVGITNGWTPAAPSVEPIAEAVRLQNISVTFESRIRQTNRTHAVQNAFDIESSNAGHPVIRGLSLRVKPGEILLVTGSSGSGKSTLLNLLSTRRRPKEFKGTIYSPENYRPGTFKPLVSDRALVDALATKDVRETLAMLGTVGLSDAFVYLKRFRDLSHGQQYRAMLANLLISNKNVWIADEFCSALDPVTAAVVADRLQSVARKSGAVLIVASSQPDSFVAALKPDQVLCLTTGWDHKILPGSAFTDLLCQSPKTK